MQLKNYDEFEYNILKNTINKLTQKECRTLFTNVLFKSLCNPSNNLILTKFYNLLNTKITIEDMYTNYKKNKRINHEIKKL